MNKLMARLALVGLFAMSMLPAHLVLAQGGTTSSGGSTAGNSGSSGDKADKSTQENAESSDKSKQK